ncbi:GNAT family N-acetyltransferase [Campylobacter sp. RM12651]|uniref:GNAT family N-acetyltransferase n=1 Tax=Campylobacter sp. RM12651 TaxID=1660079 RepID=UPI001EFBFCE0|nr:GNAT family N-acetyltransferase [Campylobacter sp. RM12651]ULO03660.1 ribosomal-protein-S18-alanine N-acetyltransferase [Campylobacter sp. RM12651]
MIIKATKTHLKDLLLIEEECFKNDCFKLGKNNFLYHIKKENIFIFLCDKKVAGYIMKLTYKNSIRIYSLAIKDEFKGLKIGTKLCEELINNAKVLNKEKIFLEVRVSNINAINLYKKFQFKEEKILKNYYSNEDGIKMTLILKPKN